MPGASELALFTAAALALLAVPGPAVLFIVAQSVGHGRSAGLVSVAGIHLGSLVHVAAATAGLSALLVSSAEAYAAVRYAGAAYLVWLGLRRLLAGAPPSEPAEAPPAARSRLLRDGFVVNVLNPKTALFFLAFLPQFVDPGAGPVALQTAVLGLAFVALGLVSDGAYALAAGALAGRLRAGGAFARLERFLSGGLLVGLGVVAAVGSSKK